MKKSVCLAVAFAAATTSFVQAADPPEFRGVYVPVFDNNTQSKADAIISDILASNINQVFVQVRGRADAYYYPNRDDSTYPNPEPRGQLYTISPSDLDTLQYYIDAFHHATPPREVHAWMTTFNSWNRVADPVSSSHVLNAHPDWITENEAGVTYTYTNDAPLDPGIPAVQDYLYNVFMDVVRNYDVDGVQFDYIRLLNSDSGYDPVAKAEFLAETGWDYDTDNGSGQLDEVFEAWRRDQISQLVQRVHERTMLEKPWVEVSAFLVNFSDSVEVLGQGYNYWVANDFIDVLHPGCYSSTVTGTVNDWDFYVGKLAQNGDENKRPLIAAIGSYLFTDGGNPGFNETAVTTLRGNTRATDGFNFFQKRQIFNDPVYGSQLADDLFNVPGPMDDVAPIPAIAHKAALGEETTPPNAPASASVVLVGNNPEISFSRPAAAADGDLPVHYRLYRDSDASVDLDYSNMVMEWWDLDSGRTSFSWSDTLADGNVWYSIVAYDNWNNSAATTVGPVTASSGAEIIIESRDSAGVTTTPANGYTQTGSWFSGGSSVKSTASGLVGTGTEFSTNSSLNASYTITPDIQVAGLYDIYITTPSAASIDAANSTFSITHAGGPTNGTVALTAANTGNQWTLLASGIQFAVGTGGSVTVSEASPQGNRFYSDAMRFVLPGTTPVAKEPKPQVTEPVNADTEAVVDSSPQALNYDDFGGSGAWATSTVSGYYNGNARFYSSSNVFPVTDYAVWIVDLPRSGNWAIDGWVHHNLTFAQQAQYRFTDGNGVVRSVQASQRSTFADTNSGDWLIDVDGVSNANAYFFNEGRVYVTLYGNAAGAEPVIADALRFRYIDTEAPAAPTGLGAVAGDGSVSLDWNDNGEADLNGYSVYRSTTSGSGYTLIAGILASSSYTDNTAANGVTYYYVITAEDNSGNESLNSSEASATPQDTTAPSSPTGLGATAGSASVSLDWNNNAEGDLDGYNVYRSTISGSGYTKLNGSLVATSDYTDNTAVNGTTYYYVVTAVDTSANESSNSIEVSATPSSAVPANAIDFDNFTVSSYGSQDVNTSSWAKHDGGTTLELSGNTWKMIALNYNVTASTVIEFDYRSTANEPEIGGVCFDNDTALSSNQTWKVYGTQAWGIATFDNYTGTTWTHYRIPVGQTLTAGSYTNLVFLNDHDGGSGSNSWFRNIVVYESEKVYDNDNGAPEYTETGSWNLSGSTGYNGGTYHYATAGASSTATWDLDVPISGSWKIDVMYRASGNRSTDVNYNVSTAGGTQNVVVDQTQNNLIWVTLGTWNFNANSGSVTLDAAASTTSGAVISDAVRATHVP